MIDNVTTLGSYENKPRSIRLELGDQYLEFIMDYYCEEFLDRIIDKFTNHVCPYYNTPLWRKLEGI